MIESALRTRLLEVAAVTDLVGERIYPGNLPQPCVFPALRFARVSGQRATSHDGLGGSARPRVQFDSYSPHYDVAHQLADAVVVALCGDDAIARWRAGRIDEQEVRAVLPAGVDQDGYEDDTQLHFVSRDFFVHHKE